MDCLKLEIVQIITNNNYFEYHYQIMTLIELLSNYCRFVASVQQFPVSARWLLRGRRGRDAQLPLSSLRR